MSDETTAPDPIGPVAVKMIALSFKLVDYEINHLPTSLEQALKDPKVLAAIQKSLADFARTRQSSSTTVVSNAEATKFMLGTLEAGSKAVGDAALDRLKKSARFKTLETSFQSFLSSAKASPAGIWVDKHQGLLIVIGSVLLVGSSVALFATRTGGILADGIGAVVKNDFEVVHIGGFSLKAGITEFKPDAQVLGAKLILSQSFERITLDLKLALTSDFTKGVTHYSGDFTFTLKDAIKLNVGVEGNPLEQTYDLHVDGSAKTTIAGHGLTMTCGLTASQSDLAATGRLNLNLGKGANLSLAAGYGVNSAQAVGINPPNFQASGPKLPSVAAALTFKLEF